MAMQADSADAVNYEWLLCALVARAGGSIRLTPSELVRWGLGTRLRMSFDETAPNVLLQLDERTSRSLFKRWTAPGRSPPPPTAPATTAMRFSYDFSPRQLAPPQLPVTHSYHCPDERPGTTVKAVKKPKRKPRQRKP